MKRLIIQLEEAFHKKIKMQALSVDKSIKQYVTDLLEKDLQTKKEESE